MADKFLCLPSVGTWLFPRQVTSRPTALSLDITVMDVVRANAATEIANETPVLREPLGGDRVLDVCLPEHCKGHSSHEMPDDTESVSTAIALSKSAKTRFRKKEAQARRICASDNGVHVGVQAGVQAGDEANELERKVAEQAKEIEDLKTQRCSDYLRNLSILGQLKHERRMRGAESSEDDDDDLVYGPGGMPDWLKARAGQDGFDEADDLDGMADACHECFKSTSPENLWHNICKNCLQE